ncbi:MAG: hypothetical protein IPN86_08755 [Saprospiraceae bacterium]|nr:hypothetical protein [Saprospiraceae bacterium]
MEQTFQHTVDILMDGGIGDIAESTITGLYVGRNRIDKRRGREKWINLSLS